MKPEMTQRLAGWPAKTALLIGDYLSTLSLLAVQRDWILSVSKAVLKLSTPYVHTYVGDEKKNELVL